MSALLLVSLIAKLALNPRDGLPWVIGVVVFVILFAGLLMLRSKSAEVHTRPGSVWASGFGANELLVVTPVSTLIIDYAALMPPRDVGRGILLRVWQGNSFVLPRELVPPEAFALLQHRATP